MFKTTFTSIVPAGRAKEHAALVAEHTKDERDVEARVLTLRRDIERDDERCAQVRAGLDEVTAHRYRFQLEASQLSHQYDARRGERERAMRDLADSRIDEFLDWIARRTRRPGPAAPVWHGTRGTRAALWPTRDSETICMNGDAVQQVAEALIQARHRADALKYQTVPDVGAALDEIRRSVPTVDAAEQAIRSGKAVA